MPRKRPPDWKPKYPKLAVPRRSLADRFWEKVNKDFIGTGCWEWTACGNPNGYGLIFTGNTIQECAHRVVFRVMGLPELPAYRPNGDALVLDHLCKNKRCVNPDHLELVTQAENCGPRSKGTPHWVNKNKTHCVRGHEFTPENTQRTARGHRACKACLKARLAELRAERRAARMHQ